MRVATLADWRKSQIAALKAQYSAVKAEQRRLSTQAADLEALIGGLGTAQLQSKATTKKSAAWTDDSERDGKTKPKRKLSPAHKRALMAGRNKWQAKKGQDKK